jgi:FkbM family methyltransferase
MTPELRKKLSQFVAASPLNKWPVRVRAGLAKGARWTLLPYSSYWRGKTEMDVEAAIKLHGTVEGASCWDLGSHYGIYAVGMAMAVGPRGRVAAFEPDPISFAKVRCHVEMNHLTWCRVFNAACSDHAGRETLIIGTSAGEPKSHLHYEDEAVPAEGTVTVETVVLDELVRQGTIAKPDFVKVDVEGHGAKALAGAMETIRACRPTLVMSCHSIWEWQDTEKLLAGLGYTPRHVTGEPMTWEEFGSHTAVLKCG